MKKATAPLFIALIILLTFQNCTLDTPNSVKPQSSASTASVAVGQPDPSSIGLPGPGPITAAAAIPPSAIVDVVIDPTFLERLQPNRTQVDLRVRRYASGGLVTAVVAGMHWGQPCAPGHSPHPAAPELCLRYEPVNTASQFISLTSAYDTLGMIQNGGFYERAFYRGRGSPPFAIVALDPFPCSTPRIYDMPGSIPSQEPIACLRLAPIDQNSLAIVDLAVVANGVTCPPNMQNIGPLKGAVPPHLCARFGTFAQNGRVLTHLSHYGSKPNGDCADGDVEIGTYGPFTPGSIGKLCARY